MLGHLPLAATTTFISERQGSMILYHGHEQQAKGATIIVLIKLRNRSNIYNDLLFANFFLVDARQPYTMCM